MGHPLSDNYASLPPRLSLVFSRFPLLFRLFLLFSLCPLSGRAGSWRPLTVRRGLHSSVSVCVQRSFFLPVNVCKPLCLLCFSAVRLSSVCSLFAVVFPSFSAYLSFYSVSCGTCVAGIPVGGPLYITDDRLWVKAAVKLHPV